MAAPGGAGTPGANPQDGGGGGGGGFNATVDITSVTSVGNLTASAGGAGGGGETTGGGGGGGAGGAQFSFTANADYSLINAIRRIGGAGGVGGTSSNGFGGAGGSGGAGAVFLAGGSVNVGAGSLLSGGAGGAGGVSGVSNGANGSGGVGIVGANLTVTNNGTISGGLSGDGVTLANAIMFTGGTNFLTLSSGATAGTLTGGIGISGSLTIDPGPVNGASATLANVISDATGGPGSISVNTTRTLTLTGANTYSGGTTLTAGTISVGNSSALGSGTLSMAAGTALSFVSGIGVNIGNAITVAGDPTFTTTPGTPQTISGTITDATGPTTPGAVVVNGGGVLTLSGQNTFSLGTTISGTGTTVVATNSTPNTSSSIGTGTLTLDGGTLQQLTGNSLAFSNGMQINSTGGTLDATNGTLTWTGSVTNGTGSPAGTLNIVSSTGGGTVVFNPGVAGSNTYSGATIIGDGTNSVILAGGSANAFSANSALTVNAASTVDLGGFNQQVLSLAGVGSMTNGGSSAATLTIGAASGVTATFSGTISDGSTNTLMLAKSGGSTQILAGANTYSGGTVVFGGTLQLDHATGGIIDAAGTSAIGVTTGGTLELAVSGTLTNAIEIGGTPGGTIAATSGTTAALTGAFQSIGGNATFGSTTDTGTIVLAPSTIMAGPPLTTLEVAGGILQAGSGNSGLGTLTANAATTQIDGGAQLDFNGNSATILNLQGAGKLSNGTSATTVVNSGSFSGVIAGAGALEVSVSTGLAVTPTLTLSGVNTYTGATTVDAGTTLALSGAGAIAHSSGVEVEGTFDISAASGGTSIKALDSLTTSGQVNLGANTLTLTAADGVYSGTLGAVGDTGGFAVVGGTAIL
ncbi:autotransporter-associated beta strand repeat-containing protein, partial [Bradyrhizobium sp. S69]|uniref:beta strand repeat-containing protein n=1 Tax=Bradyrhizobium sp. S69 TaxID=1641856 RepID=UPI0024BF78EC